MNNDKPISSRRRQIGGALSPQDRATALELLRNKKGPRRFKQVEKLLGWNESHCMPFTKMARALGLTLGQFRWLIDRDSISAQQERRRAVSKDADKVPLTLRSSQELRFSIMLPRAWRTDYVLAPYAPENQFLYWEQFLMWQAMEEAREQWGADDPLSDPITTERRRQLMTMRVGMFRAWPKNRKDAAALTVTRLQLTEPLTALEIYRADKPHWRAVGWAYRAPKTIDIDGAQAICYQYEPLGAAGIAQLPIFMNIYLAEGTEGWIFACSCREGGRRSTFEKYRPLFQRIARSFRRIHAV